jgi:hypothetical protein
MKPIGPYYSIRTAYISTPSRRFIKKIIGIKKKGIDNQPGKDYTAPHTARAL